MNNNIVPNSLIHQPISTTVPDHKTSKGAKVSEKNGTQYDSAQPITNFLRSEHFPEFERQFRHDLAVVRKIGQFIDYRRLNLTGSELLDWFEKMIFERRWEIKDELSFIYGRLRSEVRQCVQKCVEIGVQIGVQKGEPDQALRHYSSRQSGDAFNKECWSQTKSACEGILDQIFKLNYQNQDSEVLKRNLARCKEAVFTHPSDSATSPINRLCEKFSCGPETLKFSILSKLPATGERVYSILDDCFFWVEAKDGHCRQPTLNDLLSLNFANCSPRGFRMLAKQAIDHADPIKGELLLKFIEHKWKVNGERYCLFKDAEIVNALKKRLQQLPELRSGLIQAINGKRQAVTADLTGWCREPDVVKAYLLNQRDYKRYYCRVGVKASVTDKLLNLPANVLQQLGPEFYTRELGKNDRQALIKHHLDDNDNSDLAFAYWLMALGMEDDAALTSSSGLNILGLVAKANHYTLLPKLQKLKGIDPNQEGKSGFTALTDYLQKCSPDKMFPVIMGQLLSFPGTDVNHKNTGGLTPLMVAARRAISGPIDRLLRHPVVKANLNLQDDEGKTALMHASQECRANTENCLKILVKTEGINLNVRDKKGRTALMLASMEGYDNRLKILLEQNKLEKNYQDNDGNTALMQAIIKRKRDWDKCVKLLVDSGVNLTCCNKAGKNAYQLACKHLGKEHEVSRILEPQAGSKHR